MVMNMLEKLRQTLWEEHQLQGLTSLLYRIPAAQCCIEAGAKSVQSQGA